MGEPKSNIDIYHMVNCKIKEIKELKSQLKQSEERLDKAKEGIMFLTKLLNERNAKLGIVADYSRILKKLNETN